MAISVVTMATGSQHPTPVTAIVALQVVTASLSVRLRPAGPMALAQILAPVSAMMAMWARPASTSVAENPNVMGMVLALNVASVSAILVIMAQDVGRCAAALDSAHLDSVTVIPVTWENSVNLPATGMGHARTWGITERAACVIQAGQGRNALSCHVLGWRRYAQDMGSVFPLLGAASVTLDGQDLIVLQLTALAMVTVMAVVCAI